MGRSAGQKKRVFLPALLCAGILFFLCAPLSAIALFAAESQSAFVAQNIVNNGEYLGEAQLLQKCMDAINGRKPPADLYGSIPPVQTEGLGVDEFSAYMQALYQEAGTTVNAYSEVGKQEREALWKDILFHRPELAAREKDYKFFWLETSSQTENRKILFPLKSDGKGGFLLAADFIRDSLDLLSYANLYFSTIQGKDATALANLVSCDYDNAELRRKKAELTMAYYGSGRLGEAKNFKLRVLRWDAVCFSQTVREAAGKKEKAPDEGGDGTSAAENGGTLTPSESSAPLSDLSITEGESAAGKGKGERFVWFLPRGSKVVIRDAIPSDSADQLRKLTWGDSRELRLPAEEGSFDEGQIPRDSRHLTYKVTEEDPLFREKSIAVLHYYLGSGYSLALSEDRDGRKFFLFLALYSSEKAAVRGPEMRFGLSRESLMETYPFLDVNDNQLDLGSALRLRFLFEKDRLRALNYYSPRWRRIGDAFNKALPKFK